MIPDARRLGTPTSPASHEATVASLAAQAQTAPHVVNRLYDQEMSAMQAEAKAKNFISIIAGRRVKDRLSALKPKNRETPGDCQVK